MDWWRITCFVSLALFIAGTIFSFVFLKNRRKELALLLFSFAFSFFIAEISLKLFYPQIMEHGKMFEHGPYLGWKFIPNQRGSIVYRGEANHYIETNSLGFRDNPLPADEDKMRKILVIGDSFVSNISVRDNKVFTEVIERQLKNTAVLNFGVPGYGQVQEYLLLKKWFDKISPDLVILVIYVRNDFEDNIGRHWFYNPRPIVSWDKEKSTFKINPPPQPITITPEPSWKIYHKSHLYHFLRREVGALEHKLDRMRQTDDSPSLYTPPELYLCSLRPSEKTKLMYKTMEELLLRISSYLDERSVPLVFAIAPSIVQVEDKRWSRLLKYAEKSEKYIRSLPNDKLMQFAEENNVSMIDLLPRFQSEAKKGKILYNRVDSHWNSDGNLLVAHSLLEYLKGKSLVE